MSDVKLRPLGTRILVRRLEAADKIGSIYLPDDAKEKPKEGTVVALGDGQRESATGTFHVEHQVKVGDVVVFGGYVGTEIEVDGETLICMEQGEVMAVRLTE